MEEALLELLDINTEKFSYSKLSTFEQCAYKYKLVYVDKHHVKNDSIATFFGTLVHHTEEMMGNAIIDNQPIDYDKLIYDFINLNDEENKIYGTNKLKEMYPEEFFELDKTGRNYQDKTDYYITKGIFRLKEFLDNNPNLSIIDTEKEFNFLYKDKLFHGFIDRIYYDKLHNEYLIEDIKTYKEKIEAKKLSVPLQMVIYTLALKDILGENINVRCSYELVLIGEKQFVKNLSYVELGQSELDEVFKGIQNEEFVPNPTPLCHWCPFCPTNAKQPEEGKNLCPYYCKWTKENKNFSKEFPWMGKDSHSKIMENFLKRNGVIKGPITPSVRPNRVLRRR